MKHIIVILFISTSVFGLDVVGNWKLFNKKQPFSFCGLIAYSTILKFSENGTVERINSNNKVIFENTKRIYTIKNDKLNVYLENKDLGVVSNFILKNSSTNQRFELEAMDSGCYMATDIKHKSNTFMMCKV